MDLYSTSEAAKLLGIGLKTLARYIENGKVPAPKFLKAGKSTFHAWTDEEIENVRKLLPKIANGRKTRWQKLREKQGTQAGTPALQKVKKQPKKRKKK
jgi:excisionase family DNA binding protein